MIEIIDDAPDLDAQIRECGEQRRVIGSTRHIGQLANRSSTY